MSDAAERPAGADPLPSLQLPPVAAPTQSPSTDHTRGLFILASFIIAMFFVMMLVMSYHEVPDKNRDLLNTLLGVLAGTGFASVVGFFFHATVNAGSNPKG
jgi:hypothetical protein